MWEAAFILLTYTLLPTLWKVIVKQCVESLRQAHEVIHKVRATSTLFVQPFTIVI